MELRTVHLTDPVVAPLLEALHEEYLTRYGPNDELSQAGAPEFEPPTGLFLVLLDGQATAAGGGYRAHGEGICEIKRMWTNPAHRRQGLAIQVLTALEEAAAGVGYRRVVLETGPRQPEAAALYERQAYLHIERYGRYEQALAFGKDLPN